MSDRVSPDADVAPMAWIDEAYFERVLETYLHTDVTVRRYGLKSGAPAGQNFMSAIVRATVQYTVGTATDSVQEVSLILKTKLQSAELADSVEELHVFEIEKSVYGPVMKAIRELLTSFGDCTQFVPRMIYEDANALVLEDLTPKGYRSSDRRARLDRPHCELLLRKLAKYHAATAVLARKNRDLFRRHETSTFLTEGNPIHLFYRNAIEQCVAVSQRVPTLQRYTRFLEELGETAIEREGHSYERDEDGFNVLNHGDLWLNNFMWTYDEQGVPEDVMMVDFQESFYGSAGFDLNHFLYTSPNSDLQRAGFDDLVRLYADTLLDALKQFKYDGKLPTAGGIAAEMSKTHDHAAIVTTCIVPVMIVEDATLATPENMLGDEKDAVRARQIVFGNPNFAEILEILLPRLVRQP